MQAEAIRFCQLDACRLGGVNEVLAVMLLAKRFEVSVCPHAGGVGLCEYVSHLALVDYVCISGSLDGRVAEYVSHLHEHFENPAQASNGRYRAPTAPGYGITMKRASLDEFRFPDGPVWTRRLAARR
jgi:L-fuconate dehydratase